MVITLPFLNPRISTSMNPGVSCKTDTNEGLTSLTISIYSFEELLESCLVYTLLTIVKLHDTIRCLDKATGTLIVLVAGVLENTDVGWIALVEIFRLFTSVVEICDVLLVLLKSIALELIA